VGTEHPITVVIAEDGDAFASPDRAKYSGCGFSIDGIERASGRSLQDGIFRKASMSSMPRPPRTSSKG